jgi:hypothetical protein
MNQQDVRPSDTEKEAKLVSEAGKAVYDALWALNQATNERQLISITIPEPMYSRFVHNTMGHRPSPVPDEVPYMGSIIRRA